MKLAIFTNSIVGVNLAYFLHNNKHKIEYIFTNDLSIANHFRKTPVIYYKELQKSYLENIDLGVVAVFNIIPKHIFEIPKYGMINLHYSLLPAYGGPIPLYWQIKNNEKITGVTVHFISSKIDGGKIIIQKSTKLIKNIKKMELILQPIGQKTVLKAIAKIIKYGRDTPPIISKTKESYYSFSSKK